MIAGVYVKHYVAGAVLVLASCLASRSVAGEPLGVNSEQAAAAQVACASVMKLPVGITNSIGIPFRLVPSMSYVMGSDAGREDAPARVVTLTRPFYLGTYEVTRQQWEAVTHLKRSDFFPGETMPINHISYREAQRFITALNTLEKRAVNGYRLPAEAEWELAARAGEPQLPSLIESQGWTIENSRQALHEIGSKTPNAFGLYDMHGNVWEWCEDFYKPLAYRFAGATNPVVRQPNVWSYRVIRGGSAFHEACDASAGNRAYMQESRSDRFVGFRIVMPIASAQSAARADAGEKDETSKSDDQEGDQ